MNRRAALGLGIWIVVLGGLGTFALSESGRPTTQRLVRFAGESPRRLHAVLPPGTDVRRFDPVLRPTEDGFLRKVGWVERAVKSSDETIAILIIYPEHADLMRAGVRASMFTVPGTAGWIAKTLVPPEQLEAIGRKWGEFWLREKDEVFDALRPQLLATVGDLVVFFQREVPAALARHSDEWAEILEHHRSGAFESALIPVLREVGLVRAREEFEPLVRMVGEELWRALPLWDLGLRAFWERVPLTADEQVKRRFERFLRDDAGPILASHADEFLAAAKSVIDDSLRDPRVRAAIGTLVRDVSQDEKLLALLRAHLDELVLKNEGLGALLRERWNSEEMRTAMATIGARFEPLFKDVVNSIVLAEDRKTINPRLAMVLRTRVLRKDPRWIQLTPGDGADLEDGTRVRATIDG